MPEYYNKRINLFIGLAPIVRMEHISNIAMVVAAQLNEFIAPTLLFLHIYNHVDMGYHTRQMMGLICKFIPKFCAFIQDGQYDFYNDIDNLNR